MKSLISTRRETIICGQGGWVGENRTAGEYLEPKWQHSRNCEATAQCTPQECGFPPACAVLSCCVVHFVTSTTRL